MRAELPRDARCALHPQSPAAAVCARCGAFACLGCAAEVRGQTFCSPCLPFTVPRGSWQTRVLLFGPLGWVAAVLLVGTQARSSDTAAGVTGLLVFAGPVELVALLALWVAVWSRRRSGRLKVGGAYLALCGAALLLNAGLCAVGVWVLWRIYTQGAGS